MTQQDKDASAVLLTGTTRTGTRAGVKHAATRIREILGLETDLVGVLLQGPTDSPTPFANWERVKSHRYCQALMRARHGAKVVLEAEEISCPAAAAVFGVAPLPEGLACGRGLKGFGIVAEDATGAAMFAGMTRLPAGRVARIVLAPAEDLPAEPDVVVVEGTVESLMWIVLADLNLSGGQRCAGETAVLQATCVDATLLPYVQGRLNFSLGCYGCREATDMGPGEAVLGFPGKMLSDIGRMIEYLAERAIPKSRSKSALGRLLERGSQADHATGEGGQGIESEEGPFETGRIGN